MSGSGFYLENKKMMKLVENELDIDWTGEILHRSAWENFIGRIG